MATMTAPRMYQTRIDIAQDKRQKLIEMLNRQLAGTLDLYSQTKQAHWNVKGINFYQIHELFDELAESIFKYIDMIAERATALGGYAMGTARMAAQGSDIPEYPREAIEGQQHLEAMIERWARYAVGLLVLAAIAGLVLNVAVARSPRLAGSPLNRVCRGIELTLRPTPLEDWIHRQTPRDAVFLVPPDYEEFAVRTQRAPVATWKRDIYRRGGWSEWYQRIVDASGGSVTLESTRGAGSSNAVSAMVARAYERLPDEVVTALARNYGAQYCIMREGGATPTRRFEVVQRWQDLVVYRLAGMAE